MEVNKAMVFDILCLEERPDLKERGVYGIERRCAAMVSGDGRRADYWRTGCD